MGWEFRIFVQLPAGKPCCEAGLPLPHEDDCHTIADAAALRDSFDVIDVFGAPTALRPQRPVDRDREQRADVYLDVGNPSLGLKFRDVDPVRGSGGRLELKVRSERKRRGAERWKKIVSGGCGKPAEALAKVDSAAAAAAASATQVLLRKVRWQGIVQSVPVEQTDLEVLVRGPVTQSATAGGAGGWVPLPVRYRTVSFEGSPADAYALAGRWLQLPEEWVPEHLEAALAEHTRPDGADAGSALPALAPSGVAAATGEGLPIAIVGGYPEFVAAIVAAFGSPP